MSRRATRCGLAAFALLAAQLGMVEGQDDSRARNFHFAHLSWKHCRDTTVKGKVLPGFQDPAFPEVCSDRTSAASTRRMGFTIHAMWPNGGIDPSSMLVDYSRQLVAFRNQCNRTLVYPPSTPCYLSVSRGTDIDKMRTIGWREGLGSKSIPVQGASAGLVQSAAKGSRDYQEGRYNFIIERESPDAKYLHARFSFEIEFASGNKYYSVFFEGCCRPDTLKNNAGLVFHVRTEVFVNSNDHTDFPMSSFKFAMPPEILLKRLGPGACDQIYCRPGNCFIDYMLQGFHEEPFWHERVRFRKSTPEEQGRYKCYEKRDIADPESAVVWQASRCPTNVNAQSWKDPVQKLFDETAKLMNDGSNQAGVVRFDVEQQTGSYNAVWVAEIELPNGIRLASVLDMKVQIVAMESNDQPFAFFPDILRIEGANPLGVTYAAGGATVDVMTAGICPASQGGSCAYTDAPLESRVDLYSFKNSPIVIQCGRPEFMFPPEKGGRKLGTAIEFAFMDPDFKRPIGSCTQFEGQEIGWIDEANMFPKGVTISNTLRSRPPPAVSNGVSFVELRWKPSCEDRSQIGLFEWCFYAMDSSTQQGFVASTSVPSPYPSRWGKPRESIQEYVPSCIFVRSLGPELNPAPVLNTDAGISKVCCGRTAGKDATPFDRCTQAGWLDPDGVKVGNAYVLGCPSTEPQCTSKFELVVTAVSQNDLFNTNIIFFFPDAQNIENFERSPPKYGCDHDLLQNPVTSSQEFASCTSNPSRLNRVAQKLTVLMKDTQQNSIRICYQALQTPPPDIDPAAWQGLYGNPPANQSCVTCFMLNVINQPIWPIESRVDNSKPINVAVNSTAKVKLTARTLGSGATQIFVLGDPGAPDGSRLGPMESLANGVFRRDFEYMPPPEHAGLTSLVCFTASLETEQGGAQQGGARKSKAVDSEALCYEFYVYVEQVKWFWRSPCPFFGVADQGCRPQGVVAQATVGCLTDVQIQAVGGTIPYYDMQLQVVSKRNFWNPKYPTCSNCFEYFGKNSTKNLEVVGCSDTVTNECCGDDTCNGAESGWSCPEDCPQDDSSLKKIPKDTYYQFSFTPSRHQQGRQVLICIEVYTEVAGTRVISQRRQGALAPSVCLVFDIVSCRYCVPGGATLKSMAKHYFLNVDWLRLYNSNPNVVNPDFVLTQEAIQVGPIYSVAPGDTLLSIAATMKTTVKMLMEHNPHIRDNGIIYANDKVCVLLCSASR